MHTRRRGLMTGLGLGLGTTLLLLQISPSAAAGDPERATGPEAAALADRYKLTPLEAQRRLRDLPAVDRFIQSLQESDAVSTAAYDMATHSIKIYSTAPESLQFEGAPVATSVHRAAASRQEMSERRDAAASALLESKPFPRSGEVSLRSDANSGQVLADYAPGASEEQLERAERFAEHNPWLVVVRDSQETLAHAACDVTKCDPPLRAGIATKGYTATVDRCTSGFLANSTVDGKLYMLNAAHCSNGVTSEFVWSMRFSNSEVHRIGKRWNGVYSGDVDAQIIDVENPYGWNAQPYFYFSSGYTVNPTAQVNGRFSNSSFYVGMPLCKTGAISGTTCGNVIQLDAVISDGAGHSVNNQVVTDGCAQPGDSGGPVYRYDSINGYRTAAGVLTGSHSSGTCSTPRTAFTRIASAETALRVAVDTTYNNYV